MHLGFQITPRRAGLALQTRLEPGPKSRTRPAYEAIRDVFYVDRDQSAEEVRVSVRPNTRHASTNDVTASAVPPSMNAMTTMSQAGRWL